MNLGGVMGHIVIQVGENEIESVITRRSVEEMKLQAGDEVTVVIKSTEVMIQKPRTPYLTGRRRLSSLLPRFAVPDEDEAFPFVRDGLVKRCGVPA